ncbi:(2Fe-2S) ferredoxin domain-containing protein [Propionibacterium freudenreichii]|uniref:(2Fe-2S) ferredoxin domain-containing protein n=2 Tax=Propionibacterium freudenreichii TaxID=1744 RepID=UPI0022FD7A00|nr:(2Fe-2S) ferredoxin domain-containing protein [Propionibacterium freudenreichii]
MAAEERGWQVVLVSMNATSNAAVQAWGEQLPGVASASLEGDGTPLVEVLDELAGVDASPGAGPEGRASTSGRAPLGSSGVGIRLIGCQPGGGATSVSWLRRVAGHWLRTRRDGAPAVVLQVRHERHDGAEPPDVGPLCGPVAVASAPGEFPCDDSPSGARWDPISGEEAPLHSPAWQAPPPFRRHLLVCCGVRCNAQGSREVVESMVRTAKELGVVHDEVLITRTLCLFPCNQAPVVVSYPDNQWHGGVTPAQAAEIVRRAVE